MKTRLVNLMLVSIILLTTNCSTNFKFKPIVDKSVNQEIIFSDGEEVIISQGNETSIAIYGIKTQNIIELYLCYLNTSNKNINFNPEIITVKTVKVDGLTDDLKVYSAEEWLNLVRSAQAAEELVKTLNAISAAVNPNTSNTTINGNIAGNPFSANINDPNKQTQINQKNIDNITTTRILNNIAINELKNQLLKKNTVIPGQYIAGKVMVKNKNAPKYIITIPAGSDTHVIEFQKPQLK